MRTKIALLILALIALAACQAVGTAPVATPTISSTSVPTESATPTPIATEIPQVEVRTAKVSTDACDVAAIERAISDGVNVFVNNGGYDPALDSPMIGTYNMFDVRDATLSEEQCTALIFAKDFPGALLWEAGFKEVVRSAHSKWDQNTPIYYILRNGKLGYSVSSSYGNNDTALAVVFGKGMTIEEISNLYTKLRDHPK
jgi:hypothetical protein